MMYIVPYRHFHLAALAIQDAQATMSEMIKPEYAKALEAAGPAYTAMDGSEVIACAGLAEQWAGRATAWSILSKHVTGSKFVRLHKIVQRFLDMQDYARLEMTVDQGFEQGVRWAEMLGFECEGLMRKYSPNGTNCYLYARVK